MPKTIPPPPKVSWVLWARLIVWACVLAGLAFGARQVNGFLSRDPRFGLDCNPDADACANIEIRGAVYANRTRLRSVFAKDFGASVFDIPLAERRRRLLAVDWVSAAAVSRVWPDRIVIAVEERRPVAFARLPIGTSASSRLALIDDQGVILSVPPRVRFHLPVLNGVREDQPEAERRTRVRSMERLLDDLGPLAKDVSEVNAANTRDMRLISPIDGHAVELWMGDQNFRSRFMNFQNHYQDIRRHSERSSVFDLRMDDRILAKQDWQSK